MKEYNFKYSEILPPLSPNKYETLKENIKQHGIEIPIIIDDQDNVIDGQHRLKIAVELGIENIPLKVISNLTEVEKQQKAIDLNIQRRELSKGQLACVAVDAEEVMEELKGEARERMEVGNNQYSPPVKVPEGSSGDTRDRAAIIFNTNGKYIDVATMLKKNAPDLFYQVKIEEKTISQARREFNKRFKVEPPPLEGKYRVIYADPPWKYSDSGLDDYGHAESHYPPMSINELCEMDVEDIAENDAVLFMWVTSPFLEDVFKIIKAWGFKYKTSFVWDKIKHNFGHYNSVRHELLLVCTRGSCVPDVAELYDSVQSIERSDKHSEKPQEFRGIIETLYTYGNKIELFSRRDIDGWDIWGNEV